ncbi:MAG: hypothetical protein LW698_06710 [Planctomycetaceae bacterium]|nr:hypothetical protein [Planctomycetaceae bacterium]
MFDRLRIPYAFGGALAASFWGIPRTTQDADCLVAVPALGYQKLADALSAAGFLIDELDGTRPVAVAELRRQIADRGFMSLVHESTTVELFVPLVPLQHAILERAQEFPFADRTIRVTTAEDLILLKMAFHRQKDLMDVKGILHVQQGRLDVGYVRQSATRMLEASVAAELETLLGEYGGGSSAHGVQ